MLWCQLMKKKMKARRRREDRNHKQKGCSGTRLMDSRSYKGSLPCFTTGKCNSYYSSEY
jgi:hypothetical protein